MRKAVIPFVLSVGLITVWAVPADAASTRAEYIAQVDPICQSFVVPRTDAFKAYTKNVTRLLFSSGPKPARGDFKRTARSLNRLVQLRASLTTQIATVPPPAEDAVTVGTWLNDRRQAEALWASAASALNHFKLGVFQRRLAAGGAAFDAGEEAIAGFSFQVCLVSVN